MGPLNANLNSISKKLRLSTLDLNPEEEGNIDSKLKELMEKAGNTSA
jgi:hypothetical protein